MTSAHTDNIATILLVTLPLVSRPTLLISRAKDPRVMADRKQASVRDSSNGDMRKTIVANQCQ